jgi:glycosyltransferase involved in cell wall biosynthesis
VTRSDHNAIPGTAGYAVSPRTRVTCVVTAYQYGRFIARCLESLLGQDYPADLLEILVVDDGSTDDTREVVARFGDAVRYIHQENAGQIAATNRGIAEACGDYITLVDADDTVPPDRVSTQAAILDARPEVGLVYGDMTMVDVDDRLTSTSYHQSCGIPSPEGRVLGHLLELNFVPGGTQMFRAADRPLYHPISEHASVQDWWIAVNIAVTRELAYVPRPMLNYRRHGANATSISRARTLQLFANDLKFRRWMLGRLDLAGVDLADIVKGWLTYRSHLHSLSKEMPRPLEELAPLTPDDAERAQLFLARARIAAAAGDIERALRTLVVALAADPLSEVANEEFERLAVTRPEVPCEPLDARRFVTLVLADELLSDNALLHSYAAAFDGDDDATLVVYGPDANPSLGERVGELLAAAGLDGPESPDMLLVLGPADPNGHSTIGRSVHAVLSERRPIVPGVRVCGAGEALREHARACLQDDARC